MENLPLYAFNASQDIINLQTKYSLFSRVANIVFSTTLEEPFDKNLMQKAINLLISRNDCLRITFVKKDKKVMQYFAPERTVGNIPYVEFDTASKMNSYINRFRKKATNCFKGRVLEVVFAKNPSGKEMILFKVSHFVADTYAIGLLVNDLFAVYKALKDNTELPPMPGKFEDVLKKDLDYRANVEAVLRDKEFFNEYYTQVHTEKPRYCGLHGNNSDRWLKYKKKGNISLPYLMVRCDTEGYKFNIPSSVTREVRKWCEGSGITMSTFFYYAMCIAASQINDRQPYQLPLELLNCRATLAERKCGGTKVQSISLYTTVDFEKSFNENIKAFYEEQSQLYKHTKLSYLEVEAIQHKHWNYSMLSQITNFSYSFIPMSVPDGVSMQVHSNGKGALVAYVALMLDTRTDVIYTEYDIQTKMITPVQLVDFQNLFVDVVERVLANPDQKLSVII